MDQLTGARTLGELTDRLAAAGAKAVPPRSAKAEMLRIVSERTGYPAEMLSLDAGIESDLGIDSIKRVEILSQFRMQAPPAEQERIRAVMEKLTGARTLGEIIAHLDTGPAGAGTPRTDVGAALLHIVGERTGYPVEMLSLRSGIEADLGIDSIKRVEILSEFRKNLPAPGQEAMTRVMDALTSAQTLEAVIETLDRAINVRTAPPDNRAAQLQLIPEERPAATRRSAPQPGRVCIITDDETGRARALSAELRAAGEKPVLIRHSAEPPVQGEGLIAANLTEVSAVNAAVEHIQQAYGPVGAVYHLLPLRAHPALHSLTMDGWRAQIRTDVGSLYLIARAAQRDLIQHAASGRAELIAVTARDGALGLARPGAGNPAHSGVADFVKCLALEMDGVVCRVVDTDREGALESAHLVDELLCDERSLETGIAQKRRIGVRPALCVSGERARPKPLTSSSVVLLTGGARGITAEIARTLAAHAKPVLILAGSTPLSGDDEPAAIAGLDDATAIRSALVKTMTNGGPPRPAEVEAACRRILKNREIRSTLNDLRRAGARCEYRAVDVRNEEAFGALIDEIYAKHGRLDAVVHGAGIIEDKLLRDKTPESFDRVVGTKADSTFVLLKKLRFESLQSLVLMSSISAVFGNRGQADYAAANGIMNGLAADAFARYPGRVTAIAWGPWDRTGMVSDAVRQQFLLRGVQLIDTGDGARIVLEVLEGGFREAPLLVVGDGPWSKDAVPAESLRAAGGGA
jgi:NAD(P)-dependent dehydrogenase (short-subunit alcohol dehydrogenase family)/acyl carrier protein